MNNSIDLTSTSQDQVFTISEKKVGSGVISFAVSAGSNTYRCTSNCVTSALKGYFYEFADWVRSWFSYSAKYNVHRVLVDCEEAKRPQRIWVSKDVKLIKVTVTETDNTASPNQAATNLQNGLRRVLSFVASINAIAYETLLLRHGNPIEDDEQVQKDLIQKDLVGTQNTTFVPHHESDTKKSIIKKQPSENSFDLSQQPLNNKKIQEPNTRIELLSSFVEIQKNIETSSVTSVFFNPNPVRYIKIPSSNKGKSKQKNNAYKAKQEYLINLKNSIKKILENTTPGECKNKIFMEIIKDTELKALNLLENLKIMRSNYLLIFRTAVFNVLIGSLNELFEKSEETIPKGKKISYNTLKYLADLKDDFSNIKRDNLATSMRQLLTKSDQQVQNCSVKKEDPLDQKPQDTQLLSILEKAHHYITAIEKKIAPLTNQNDELSDPDSQNDELSNLCQDIINVMKLLSTPSDLYHS